MEVLGGCAWKLLLLPPFLTDFCLCPTQGVKNKGRPVCEGLEETVGRHQPASGEDGGASEERDEELPSGAQSHRGEV